MMGAPFQQNVIDRAEELWLESETNTPQFIVMTLGFELGYGEKEWTKNLPEGVNTRLPKDRSTISKMAKRRGWPPHPKPTKWVTDVLIEPTCQGSIHPEIVDADISEIPEPELRSGIADPIWHLSKMLAKKKAREYNFYEGPLRVATLEQQIIAIEMDVASEYDPHPKMFKELRPLIKQYLNHERGSHRQFLQKLKDSTVRKPDGTISRDLGFYDLDEGEFADAT